MTDETPTTIPAATVCPVEDCHALVPDTIEDRRAHRSGHEHRAKVDEAVRRIIRGLRAEIAEHKRDTAEKLGGIRQDVAGIDRTVGQIEIPEQLPQLTISRGAWDDDDPADDEPEPDDEWDFASPATPDADTAPTETGPGATESDEPDEMEPEPTPGILTAPTPAWTR